MQGRRKKQSKSDQNSLAGFTEEVGSFKLFLENDKEKESHSRLRELKQRNENKVLVGAWPLLRNCKKLTRMQRVSSCQKPEFRLPNGRLECQVVTAETAIYQMQQEVIEYFFLAINTLKGSLSLYAPLQVYVTYCPFLMSQSLMHTNKNSVHHTIKIAYSLLYGPTRL